MPDQADELRQLVLRNALHPPVAARPPRRIVVAGGKGGVGTTTLAVNLGVTLAQQGSRIVLVDADLQRADLARMCQAKEGETIADVLANRRTVHEVLQRGPGGVQLLPGAWAAETMPECSPAAQQRLLHELDQLGAHADALIMDVGNGLNPVAARFWQAADEVLLITTAESLAIMDAYAAVKVLPQTARPIPILTLVNRVAGTEVAREVHARVAQACHRFLGLRVTPAGHVPDDPQFAETGSPLMVRSPYGETARCLERIAQRMLARWSGESYEELTAARAVRQSTIAA